MCKVETTKEQLFKLCEEKGYCKLNDDIYSECANFLFYMSWFEELLFNNDTRQNPQKLKKISDVLTDESQKYAIDLNQLDFYGDHFCQRYLDEKDNTETAKFKNLRIKKDDDSNRARDALINYKNNKVRDGDLLWTYLMITYRFRNNMFHGAKKLIKLSDYLPEFRIINRFMYILLYHILDTQYTGYN